MKNPFKQAEELQKKLELSELRFQAIAQTATDAIIITDQSSHILFCNFKAMEIFGYTELELQGINLSILMPEKYRASHQKGMDRFLKTNIPKLIGHTVEIEGLRKDGTVFPIELSLSFWKEDEQTYFTGIIRDITVRKKTFQEFELLHSIVTEVVEANNFLTALEISIKKICLALDWDFGEAWIVNPDQETLYFAPVWYSKMDSDKEFIEESQKMVVDLDKGIRKQVFKEGKAIWNPDASDPDRGFKRADLAKKAGFKACLSVPIKTDKVVLASILFFKRTFEEENIHVSNIITSIARQLGILLLRTKTEEALRHSEEKFRFLAENSTDMITRSTPDGDILYVSPSCELLLGFKPEELLGKNAFSFYHPDDLEIMRKAYADVMQIPDISTVRYRSIKKDGTYIWIESTGRTIKNSIGDIIEIHGATRDITKTKNAEDALRNSEEALRSINTELEEKVKIRTSQLKKQREDIYSVLMQAPAMIAIVRGTDFVFELANPLYLQVIGKTIDIIGKPLLEVLPEIKGQPIHDILNNVYKTGERFIGTEVLVRIDINNDGITEEVYFNFVYEPLRNAEGVVDGILTHAIEVTNQVAARKQLEESEDRFRSMADNIPNLAWIANADGWIFWYNKKWYEYSGTTPEQMEGWGWQSIHDPNELPRVMEGWTQSIRNGDFFEMVFPLKGADNIFRPFLTRVNPIRDSEGKIIRWFGTNTDVTDRIKAEETLEKKNKELIKINNDLDNFIYTASHDLKSPVSNLEGLLNLVGDENEGLITEKGKDILPLVAKSLARLKTVIQELTEIARIQKDTEEESEVIRFDEFFKEIQLSCENEMKNYNGKITSNFSEAPLIKFSKRNLRSILYNLLSNALKYSDPEKEGIIMIKSEKQVNYLLLTISDNGLGIPKNQTKKVFTMFKRYHTHVEGTGVGLYIVKRIVENAGGKIEVESLEGKGTTFKLYFEDRFNIIS